MLLDQIDKSLFRAFQILVRIGELQQLALDELSGLVHNGDLASGADPGIDADNANRTGGRREQQRPKVVFEYLDGFLFCAVLQNRSRFIPDGRQHQALETVANSALEKRRKLRRAVVNHGGSIIAMNFSESVSMV